MHCALCGWGPNTDLITSPFHKSNWLDRHAVVTHWLLDKNPLCDGFHWGAGASCNDLPSSWRCSGSTQSTDIWEFSTRGLWRDPQRKWPWRRRGKPTTSAGRCCHRAHLMKTGWSRSSWICGWTGPGWISPCFSALSTSGSPATPSPETSNQLNWDSGALGNSSQRPLMPRRLRHVESSTLHSSDFSFGLSVSKFV